jgi:hypothetical protein
MQKCGKGCCRQDGSGTEEAALDFTNWIAGDARLLLELPILPKGR